MAGNGVPTALDRVWWFRPEVLHDLAQLYKHADWMTKLWAQKLSDEELNALALLFRTAAKTCEVIKSTRLIENTRASLAKEAQALSLKKTKRREKEFGKSAEDLLKEVFGS